MPFAVTATPMLKLVKSLSCCETLCNKAVYYFFLFEVFWWSFFIYYEFFSIEIDARNRAKNVQRRNCFLNIDNKISLYIICI